LAAAVGRVTTWSDRNGPEPDPKDFKGQEEQQARAFAMTIFTPRDDMERRAGGNFSWNTGIDYRKQLAESGRKTAVERLYQEAGLDLEKDLDTVNAAGRITALPGAVTYFRKNIALNGEIRIPVLTMADQGDDATVISNEDAYLEVVRAAGKQDLLRQTVVHRAGHCVFSSSEQIAALLALQHRIDRGAWEDSATPAELNRRAASLSLDDAKFIDYQPARFLRPCNGREKKCAGEP